ncbi:UPF0481 protein At3g47200 [Brachypodium distachyon]|uniref:Uncharacterized protein n=1 Tax=Brachypodium distachyon TaxID=15368 RepID=I1IZF6_BRADI|nr:UPF0481 protein At3g47200 [Brachypodium distachyon]KQJ83450.1 hypothetical protein BRADI_5g15040v3 [Brachypodium distachyon]|eukprot:XP_003580099.1 UPF0481 protein At3g47200 [Brachypodium distachyon]
MVAVFNKDVLSWYLITLKLKETVDANLKKSPSPQWQPLPRNPLLTNGTPGAGGETPAPALLTTRQDPASVAFPAQSPAHSPKPQDPEWVITIRGKLAQARAEEAACPWARLSVYRVPKSLRDGDDRAYSPQAVSIGPLHHGKRRLRDMERHKWRALHHVLKRTGHDVTAYLDALRPMEDRARACYDGRVAWMPADEFVQCLVLDGTFVLELFRGALEGFAGDLGYSRHDPVFAMRGAMHAVRSDMILLENQIPLFVLDRLLGTQQGRPEQTGAVAALAVRFFDPLMPTDTPMHRKDRSMLESSVAASSATASFDPLSEPMLHCLDVFRRSLLRAGLQPTPPPAARLWPRMWSVPRRVVADKRRQQFVHCVSELREAGIRCRRRNTDRFWDIRFDKGVLHIPRILIHDGTKPLFLNLIAFEQCHHMDVDATPGGNNITSYAIFMDNLINSAEDVKYLHDRGIIEHWLGSDAEVAELFNRLCLEVVFDINDSYLSGLSDQVNRYYDYKWSTWVASLQHNYFTNPWAIVSLVAGVFLLLLTTMQTFYSAYSYYRPAA